LPLATGSQGGLIHGPGVGILAMIVPGVTKKSDSSWLSTKPRRHPNGSEWRSVLVSQVEFGSIGRIGKTGVLAVLS
jgi:hypothetical protein